MFLILLLSACSTSDKFLPGQMEVKKVVVVADDPPLKHIHIAYIYINYQD